MSASAQLAAINLWSSSSEQTAGLLGALLGAEPRRRDHADGAHFTIAAGGLLLSVHPAPEPRVELALTVSDLDAALALCAAHGTQVAGGPAVQPWGTTARVAEPGGTHLELVQPPTQGTTP